MEQINIKTVEMVRNIRDTHYEQLKDISRKERILFYREKAGRLHDRLLQQKIKSASQKTQNAEVI